MNWNLLAQAQTEPDFRVYVWWAYGAVLVLLFLFSFWSVKQLQAAERKLDDLRERAERKKEGA